jgi:HAD superfamily hydrolase (TIGR01549 family)
MKKIRAVLFDMIGTTVVEKDPTVIPSCFESAFSEYSVPVDRSRIQEVRGLNKMEAIGRILRSSNKPMELQSRIFESFTKNVEKNISNFEEHPELGPVIRQLHEREIIVGIASGLSLDLFELLFEKFQWKKYSLDYVNVYENFPEGRPHPTLIFNMCNKFQVDVTQLLKVGDTVADVEEGKNAGSVTAAILAGTQPDSILQKANADFEIRSLKAVIDIVN